MFVFSPEMWARMEARAEQDGVPIFEALGRIGAEWMASEAKARRDSAERQVRRICEKYATTTFACDAVINELVELVLRGVETHNGDNESKTAPGDTATPE